MNYTSGGFAVGDMVRDDGIPGGVGEVISSDYEAKTLVVRWHHLWGMELIYREHNFPLLRRSEKSWRDR